MKFRRERKSKSIYDGFFHDIIPEPENIRLMLKQQTTPDDSKHFQCSNIVFRNKPKPLFVGLR